MPQRFKLRLGDGTVLSVDQNGLRTWAADGQATVQAVGSWRWQPLQEVLAEEEAAARLTRALVPPSPRQEAPQPPPPSRPPVDRPALDQPAFNGLSFGEPAFSEPPVAGAARPGLQALADDPVSSGFADAPTASDDDMPVIRMRPPDDDDPMPSASWPSSVDEYADELAEEEARRGRLDGPLLTVLETVGGFLSRCLDRLAPLAKRLGSRASEESRPWRFEGAADRPTLAARVSGWIRGLTERARGLTRRRGRSAGETRAEPLLATRPLAAPKPQPLVPRETLPAPVHLSELPTLRFAESHEPAEPVDVYEGGPLSSFLPAVWVWTKRVVVLGALAAAFALAVRERDTLLPKTADLGQTVFTEIDRQVLSRQRAEQQQRALADASARLPYLPPETILIVFTRGPLGVLDPPEVFELAREAADRGLTALTKPEAEELGALQRELLAALRPTERARIDEYDRARARRLIFPFENPHVMDLVARGARALPAPRLERFRTLYGKAVAAGLAPAPGVTAGAPTAR